ncbi:hypothetical protein MMC30_006840 [Trapelia coarctata]|nr:hypothetical protein [Trapelia coarctata]
MKFIASASLLSLIAAAGAQSLEERQTSTNETIAQVLQEIVGAQVYSELVQGAPTSVLAALNSNAAALPDLVSSLVNGQVPPVFTAIPTDVIAVVEVIASEINALPSEVLNFLLASPSAAAPIISAIEAGVPPPQSAIQALPSSLVSQLLPGFQSIYGTQAVATYLAALSRTSVVTATATPTGSASVTGTASITSKASVSGSASAATATTTSATKNMGNVVVAGSWVAGVLGALGMVIAL